MRRALPLATSTRAYLLEARHGSAYTLLLDSEEAREYAGPSVRTFEAARARAVGELCRSHERMSKGRARVRSASCRQRSRRDNLGRSLRKFLFASRRGTLARAWPVRALPPACVRALFWSRRFHARVRSELLRAREVTKRALALRDLVHAFPVQDSDPACAFTRRVMLRQDSSP